MVIIKIDKKPRYKNIYYIYCDDGERVEVFDEFLILNHLKVGTEISAEDRQRIVLDSQEKIGQQVCMQSLARGEKTKKELISKLKDKGITDYKVIEKILSKISSYGYINDDKFAQNYVSIEKNRKGVNKIRFELEQKGVDNKTINKYLEQVDNQEEVALALAEKYMRNKDCTYKNKTKLYSHLASKGFSFDVITSIMHKFAWQREEDYI